MENLKPILICQSHDQIWSQLQLYKEFLSGEVSLVYSYNYIILKTYKFCVQETVCQIFIMKLPVGKVW